jgi:anaerobic nitric oxide reductase transcription regulator
MLTNSQRPSPSEPLAVLLEIARDLTASLAARDRYERLLGGVRRIIPCDAACLMRLEGEELVPLAAHGLAEEAVVRRYDRREHPRLDVILRAAEPVRFAADSPLADPFDGLLESDPQATSHIHACLGCPLVEGGEVVGALTADAVDPGAFDRIDDRVLETLGALAGAAMRTTALIETLEQHAEHQGRVARELQRAASRSAGDEIVGTSLAMARLLDELRVVAGSDLAVLITGETGVGKELAAHRIHDLSPRREQPMIYVNCAALPESIAESELFGHVKGAFTGAGQDRLGKFEIADGGTLFLDEIGELPLSIQPVLLRAIEDGEIQRVGSDRRHRVDVRAVAATNRDLQREVREGRFRADLYHRLAVYPVHVPPLRERREDIPLLAAHFVDEGRRRLGIGSVRLTEPAREALQRAQWPGNVRELANVVSRGVLRAVREGGGRGTILVGPEHLDLGAPGPEPPAAAEALPGAARPAADAVRQHAPLAERVDAFKRREIVAAVESHRGNWAAAARELGVHRSNLHHLARRLGLKSP